MHPRVGGGSLLEGAVEGLSSTISALAPPRYATSFFHQFIVLFRRSWTQISRDKFPLIISCVQAVLFGLIIGALYSETRKTQKNIQDRFGVLFFFVINTAFGSLFAVMNVFPAEKSIINRERAALAYHALPLYLAKAGGAPGELGGPPGTFEEQHEKQHAGGG